MPADHADFKTVDMGVCEYVHARHAELEQMFSLSSVVHGNARIMQRLPRHMRRRAASHNVKRLPANIRNIAQREVVNNAPNKGKRPSRKHRRRPRNLMAEYQRRQRSHVWLETHIWHAKRFHMAQHWGYRLADFPNDKGWRACQRALAQYCIMWDMSYLCCIEIKGPEEDIIKALKRLITEDAGLTVGAKTYLDGKREGTAVIYTHDAYPFSAIGPVSFIWRSVEDNGNTASRCLWLWVHPSCYKPVLEELAIVFEAKEVVEDKHDREEVENMEVDKEGELDDAKETVKKGSESGKDKNGDVKPLQIQNPEFKGSTVSFRSLKDTLCRYRLLGPKALSVLQEAFKQPENNEDIEMDSSVTKEDGDGAKYWWQEHDDYARNRDGWKEFQKYSDPSHAPRNCVLGLTVRDPRLFIPQKITNTEQKLDTSAPTSPWCSTWSESPIWEEDVRRKVKDTKMTEHQLNITRSQKLIPGGVPELGAAESRIPLLLIQQSGSSQSPYLGNGYDVVLPSGWGMPFWIALVYRGARVGGLQQLQQVDRELSRLHFLHDFPDTVAGQQWIDEHKKVDTEAYHKRPPAKRPNYQKLGTTSHAFAVDWRSLLRTDSDSDRYFVLRSRQTLMALHRALLSGDGDALPKDFNCIDLALIPVRVTPVLKGVPSPKAAICIPSESDLQSLKSDKKFPGPSEPIHAESTDKSKVSVCSRTVLGYVSEGATSLSIGKGQGIGFVSFAGLKQLLELQSGKGIKVLVRGITETVYRFHKIEVVY